MTNDDQVKRRGFLEMATWAIGGLISAGMAIPAVAYIIGPAIKRTSAEDWIQVGAISKIEIGIPTLFKVKVERKTGWIVNVDEISIYAFTENARDFVAMSNVCTHLGCRVRWISEQEQFFCPCHNAVFNKEGEVVSGPPPKPLDRYEVKVTDGQLYILVG
jgi:Rieske Fe-S protein